MTGSAALLRPVEPCLRCGGEVDEDMTVCWLYGVPVWRVPDDVEVKPGGVEAKRPYCRRCFGVLMEGERRD